MAKATVATVAPPRPLAPRSEVVLSAALLILLVVLLVPLPTLLLDLLLSLNLGLTILLLLVTLSATQPLDFSTFPSLLLLMTLLRLALNVATARLILLQAHAGMIVQAFGQFVVGGNLVVGMVIFLILIVIQFVVITKGAGRISEVTARFTLDALPGKQMAIDAELNAERSTTPRPGSAASTSCGKRNSTVRWTVPANSSAVMPLPPSSSRPSILSAGSSSA